MLEPSQLKCVDQMETLVYQTFIFDLTGVASRKIRKNPP